MKKQKCAYCLFKAGVIGGRLQRHYYGDELCPGIGFTVSRMQRLVGHIASLKLAYLEEQKEPEIIEHVCGLQGFGRGPGGQCDVFPACHAQFVAHQRATAEMKRKAK